MSIKLLEVMEEEKVCWAGEWLKVPAGCAVRQAGVGPAMPGWVLFNSDKETVV